MEYAIDQNELKKIVINKQLFALNKTDHFEIDTVLDILDMDTLPIEIPLNNNQIFIRDLSKYIVDNDLEPYINK